MGNKHIKNLNKKRDEINNNSNNGYTKNNLYLNESINKGFKKQSTLTVKSTGENRNIIIQNINPKFSFGGEDRLSNKNEDCENDSNCNLNKKINYPKTEISTGAGAYSSVIGSKNHTTIVNHKNNHTYLLNELIGTGFYSKVYLSESLNNKVAIKSIKKKHVIKNNTYKLILNEKSILLKVKNIKCNFVVELLETFQDEDKLYMVFPFYHYDLFSLLKCVKVQNSNNEILLNNYNINWNEDLYKFILAQVYITINCLHENNIIYRDLKPENIVVNDETGYIKLIDFGLSQDGVSEQTQLTQICGTNEYIPPEVIKREFYNFNFDWWGFGIFMYEIFYGYPPFRGKCQKEIFFKIINDEIYFDPSVKISNEAKDLISYLLNKDIDFRIKPEQIPYHPFFDGINLDNISMMSIQSPLDRLIKNNSNKNKNILLIRNFNGKIKENIIVEQDLFKDF